MSIQVIQALKNQSVISIQTHKPIQLAELDSLKKHLTIEKMICKDLS